MADRSCFSPGPRAAGTVMHASLLPEEGAEQIRRGRLCRQLDGVPYGPGDPGRISTETSRWRKAGRRMLAVPAECGDLGWGGERGKALKAASTTGSLSSGAATSTLFWRTRGSVDRTDDPIPSRPGSWAS